MINKIGYNIGVSSISFRANAQSTQIEDVKKNSIPELPQENKGLDALAAYNAALVKKPISKELLDIEPLIPIVINPDDIENMEGERIYSSDGKLHSIVRRDENTITIFTPSENDEKQFSLIQTFDKKSNSLILSQENDNTDDNKYIHIEEFNPETGDRLRNSTYINGNISYAGKTIKDKNGNEQHISFDYDYKEYYTTKTSSNGHRELSAYFDENKQLTSFTDYRYNKGYKTNTEVEFYHGAPVRIYVNKEMTMPNTIGWENFVNVEELKPSERFDKIEHIKDIEGDRTYYSNGALESNKFDSDYGITTAFFRPDGSCESIKNDKKEIVFDEDYHSIKETLDNGKEKETKFLKSGFTKIRLSDGNSYKELELSDKNKPSYYSEGIIQDNNEEKETAWLSFDDNGMLEYGRDYAV